MEVREVSGRHPGGSSGVGKPLRRFESGQEAHTKIRVGLVGPRGGPGGVGTFYCRSGRPSRRSVGGRDIHSKVRKALTEVRERSVCRLGGQGGPPGGLVRNGKPLGGPGEVRRSSWRTERPLRRSGRGRGAFQQVRKGSGFHPKGPGGSHGSPGGVGMSSRRSRWPLRRFGRGWDAFLEVRLGTVSPLGGPREVRRSTRRTGRPSQRSGRGCGALQQVWKGSGFCPEGTVGVGKT